MRKHSLFGLLAKCATLSVAAVAVMGCELEAHCTRVQILETAIW